MKNQKTALLLATLTCLMLLSYNSYSATNRSIIVTDTSNNRVQILDYNTGNFVLSFGSKGSGLGQFLYPASSKVNQSGTFIYVADTGNNRVQKFDGRGNAVSSWGAVTGGKLNGQFSSPNNIAVGQINNEERVYVADTGNNRIQVFNSEGVWLASWGSTKAGSGVNDFNNPQGLALDAARGALYVADTFNHRIKKYSLDGSLAGVFGGFGTGDGQMNYPKDVAMSSDGGFYVTDALNYRIQKFGQDGTFQFKWGVKGTDAGQFGDIFEVAVEQNNNVYVADAGNNRVQKFDQQGNFLASFGAAKGSQPGYFNYPEGVFVNEITLQDPTAVPTNTPANTYTGTFTNTFTDTLTETPTNTYTNTFTNTLTETPTNTFTYTLTITTPPQATATSVISLSCVTGFMFEFAARNKLNGTPMIPTDAAIDNDGNIYITDLLSHKVVKFDKTGVKVTSFAAFLNDPSGIEVHADNLYVVDRIACRVLIFTLNGDLVRTIGGKGQGNGKFMLPSKVACDKNGNFYITDTFNNRIQKFNSAGNFISAFGSGFVCKAQDGAPGLLLPGGIAVMADQTIAVLDHGRHRIVFFDQDGGFIRQISRITDKQTGNPLINWLNQDSDLAADQDGGLYAAQPMENRLIKISADGSIIWQDNGINVNNPYGLGTDGKGKICVINTGRSSISVFDKVCTAATAAPAQAQISALERVKETPSVTPIPEDLNNESVYNYPNPFSSTTTLRFELASPKEITVMITDMNGKPVWHRTLSQSETNAGVNRLLWNGVNDNGASAANGTYIMRVNSANRSVCKKIALLK